MGYRGERELVETKLCTYKKTFNIFTQNIYKINVFSRLVIKYNIEIFF